LCHVHDCPRKTSTSCALFGGHAASLSQRFAESGATASAAPGHSDQRRPRRRSGVENPGLVRLVLVLPEMLIVRLGPLRSMCRRFAKPSKKATLEPSANSHRANARNSIFAGRQKGGKRQHKATANFLCPRKLKIAPPTKTERRPIDSYRILGSCGEHRAELGGRPSRDQCECCLFLKWALRRTKTLLRGGEGNPIPGV